MQINSQNNYTIENIDLFNKLMIETSKGEDDKFEFYGKNYIVCSDGVCVQTLVDDRLLYRISVEDNADNSLVSNRLLNLLKN